jgi:uncharacterized protein YcnI
MDGRFVARASFVIGTVGALLIVGSGAASAHVTVSSSDATQGGFGSLAFRVPTESDTASTTALKVVLPAGQPLASVAVQPKPGWKFTVSKAKLAKPITSDDGQVTEAVSEIDWTATAGGIKPGEFDEFRLSVGPLPKADTMVFKVVQHYSNGTDVAWIEQAAAGAPEPAHPAPTLTLRAEGSGTANATAARPATVVRTSSSTTATAALVLAAIAAALGAGALAVGFVALRRRRTATVAAVDERAPANA